MDIITKRRCKDVDITDSDLIGDAIYKCYKNKNKNRRDIVKFNKQYPTNEEQIALLQSEIRNRKLCLKPIYYKTVIDPSSRKEREIGIQDIKQQLLDYVAVEGLERGGFLKRIGEYQCASIPNRGQSYGVNAISRWLRSSDITYACKVDIKKFYPSIKRRRLMRWLRKRIKNDLLLWLIETLIYTFKVGLSIGSYLSQYLANLYLSDIYHNVYEKYARIRHKKDGTIKRVRLVKKCIFYMDDLLFLGSNKRDLEEAVRLVIEECCQKGLTIKDDYYIYKIDSIGFVDMMGFRIYRDHRTIRRETFKHVRRAYIRFTHNPKSVRLAQRIISYNGLLKFSNCFKFKAKYSADKSFSKAKQLISNQTKLALA